MVWVVWDDRFSTAVWIWPIAANTCWMPELITSPPWKGSESASIEPALMRSRELMKSARPLAPMVAAGSLVNGSAVPPIPRTGAATSSSRLP